MFARHRHVQFALLLAIAGLTVWPTIAMAHPGHGATAADHVHAGDFQSGWGHPFSGIDHLLAMVAVGLLAVCIGGRAVWLVPAAFLGSMFVGVLVAASGVAAPGVELGLAASVLVLGVLLAAANIVPLWFGLTIVALFALFHGYAHAAQLGQTATLAPYLAGLLLATALLHTAGIATGLLLAKTQQSKAIRYVGGAIAATGVMMLVGWI